MQVDTFKGFIANMFDSEMLNLALKGLLVAAVIASCIMPAVYYHINSINI